METLRERGEKGLQANKESGLAGTGISRHGIVGFPLYRQYLIEVRPKTPELTELRYVQFLFYRHIPPEGVSQILAAPQLLRQTNERVNLRERTAFMELLKRKVSAQQ